MAFDGGAHCRMSIYDVAMSHVYVAYFSQCHMSNLRKGYVVCHSTFNHHVACH